MAHTEFRLLWYQKNASAESWEHTQDKSHQNGAKTSSQNRHGTCRTSCGWRSSIRVTKVSFTTFQLARGEDPSGVYQCARCEENRGE